MSHNARRLLLVCAAAAILLALLAPAAMAATPKATKVYLNGNVYTVNAKFAKARAFAVKNGKFLAVGSNAKIRTYIGPRTKVVSLKGATVFPGLWDAHLHYNSIGTGQMEINIFNGAKADIIAAVGARADSVEDGVWVRGWGWNQVYWTPAVFPTAADLDTVSPDNPVALWRVDGHAIWVNSKAMELNGITKDTPDPTGGRIERDAQGNPTGVFIDAAAGLISVPDYSEKELRQANRLAQQKLFSLGITSACDMGSGLKTIERMKSQYAAGTLKLRVTQYVNYEEAQFYYWEPKKQRVGLYGDKYTINGIKIVADGAMGSRGAWFMQPYSDAGSGDVPAGWVGFPTFGSYGDPPNYTLASFRSQLTPLLAEAVRYGFQPAVHAIGDATNRGYLDAVEALEQDATYGDVKGARFRDEHTQAVDLADIPRFAELGVIPSMQAQHATSDMNMAETRIGYPRILGAYAWQKFIKSGSIIPDGSDAPVEEPNPFWGLYSAVTRMDKSGNSPVGGGTPGGAVGWYADQCMTRKQALRSFTTWSAFGAFAEKKRGPIAKGMEADFVVVNRDYIKCPSADLWKMYAKATVVGGRTVYRMKGFKLF